MAGKSDIEWTDASWTPIRARNLKTGKIGWHCEHATTGCERCYAENKNKWLGTGLPFKPGHRKDIEIFLDEKMLRAPLHWKKPRMIFVCSMTDLFADFVKDEWIDQIFAVMALCPQHTFQVLTKRAERMMEWVNDPDLGDGHINTYHRVLDIAEHMIEGERLANFVAPPWPLPNLWLGISAERQPEWDERKDHLRNTPAIVHFASFEPLLGEIVEPRPLSDFIQWAIVGGESQSKARPMHPGWVRSLRDQCTAAGVSFFFKQWGEWGCDEGPPAGGRDRIFEGAARCAWWDHARARWRYEENGFVVDLKKSKGSGDWVYRLGKKATGRFLDGVEHNGMPT